VLTAHPRYNEGVLVFIGGRLLFHDLPGLGNARGQYAEKGVCKRKIATDVPELSSVSV
jgi:hypothetical protein